MEMTENNTDMADTDVRAGLNRWCEVDLGSLERNFAAIRAYLPPQVKILAVVKADAYGYGLVPCARLFAACGADMLGVTTLAEGIRLRRAGVNAPVLVFAPLLPQEAQDAAQYDLTATVTLPESLHALAAAAAGRPLFYHIKLNTGMNRMGVDEVAAAALIEAAASYPNLQLQGVYSHLATASSDVKLARAQLADFNMMCDELAQLTPQPFIRHLAASNGMFTVPEARLDMVRLGSVLYGQMPAVADYGVLTEDPWSLYGRIVAVQHVRRGAGIGYGFDEHALGNMTLGVVPLGYCDGIGEEALTRAQSLKGRLRIAAQAILGHFKNYAYTEDGMRLRFAGRIAMQSCIIDITDQGLECGDKLRFICRRTLLSADVPRVYVLDGEVCAEQLEAQSL